MFTFIDYLIKHKCSTISLWPRGLSVLCCSFFYHVTCFSNLHYPYVQPIIIDNGVATWESTNFGCIESVQYWGQLFLPRCWFWDTSGQSTWTETGWQQPQHTVWLCLTRQKCHLVRMGCVKAKQKYIYMGSRTNNLDCQCQGRSGILVWNIFWIWILISL